MHSHRYCLRNERDKTFQIEARVEGEGAAGATVRASIVRCDGHRFHYEVVFTPDYAKPNFSTDMYLHTAMSIVDAQIESHVHKDTRITLQVNSGLPHSQVGVALDWAGSE